MLKVNLSRQQRKQQLKFYIKVAKDYLNSIDCKPSDFKSDSSFTHFGNDGLSWMVIYKNFDEQLNEDYLHVVFGHLLSPLFRRFCVGSNGLHHRNCESTMKQFANTHFTIKQIRKECMRAE